MRVGLERANRLFGKWNQGASKVQFILNAAFLGLSLSLCVLQMPTRAQENAAPGELVRYVRDAEKAGLKQSQIEQNAISRVGRRKTLRMQLTLSMQNR